jgi:membrane associated rhomboid family serine protease
MIWLPYRIDTIVLKTPWANWFIIAFTVFMFFASQGMSEDTIMSLVCGGGSPLGLVGHVLLHASVIHLAGNMLFLWVFGNTVCGNTNNLVWPCLYMFFALIAGITALIFGGTPGIGASGAVNGAVGMALAMYPLNRVSVFYWIFVRWGTVSIPLWLLALIWFAFDLHGALSGKTDIGYWAHIGGLLSGLGTGMLAIECNWIVLSAYDNEPLLDLIRGRKPTR